ncbi:uncharacterized protein LOC134704867 [Mytilus trossulus]|uniref:uncharacterized protein LOC134704867 n=1 Tax=Mytilus trossulus TaxID=6551 RepID=UPI003006C314
MDIIKYIVHIFFVGILIPVMGYNSMIPKYQNILNDEKSNNHQLQREMFKPEEKYGLGFMDKMKVIQYMHGKEVGKRNEMPQWLVDADKEDEYLDNKSRKCLTSYNAIGKLEKNCQIMEILR